MHLLVIALNDSGLLSKLSLPARAVLLALMRFVEYVPTAPLPTWHCFPKLDTLELAVGFSRRAVLYATAELQDAGLLSRERSGREKVYYTLTLPPGIFEALPAKIRFSLRQPVHHGALLKCTTVHRSKGLSLYTKNHPVEDSSEPKAAPPVQAAAPVNDDELSCAVEMLEKRGVSSRRARNLLSQYQGHWKRIATNAIAALDKLREKRQVPKPGAYLATVLEDKQTVEGWLRQAQSQQAARESRESQERQAASQAREAQARQSMQKQQASDAYASLSLAKRQKLLDAALEKFAFHARRRAAWVKLIQQDTLPDNPTERSTLEMLLNLCPLGPK